jgi:phage terminase large subunit
MTDIVLPYEPRPHFIPFHQRSARWAAIVAHRRCGKTVGCINDTIAKALYNRKKNPRYGYIAPTYRQAKEIAWQYLKDDARPVVKKIREAELSIELINGAKISLFGADNPDSLRGLYFDGVILDEFGDMRPSLWGEVILPTLVDRKGWAVFIGTPKGKNHFYDIMKRSQFEEGWYSSTLTVNDTGLFTEEEIEEFRKQMSDEQFRQEFLCDFTAAITGAYYAQLLETPSRGAPYDPEQPVFVSADLGYTDSTALWFWQKVPEGYNFIDYEEADNQALSYYFDLLDYKGYQYEQIWLPHDAKAKSLQTGVSTIEQFISKRYPVAIQPRLALQHGIDAVRALLPQCYFDLENPRVMQGLDALRSYRRSYDEYKKVYRDAPLHDWTSHCADAFRGFALVSRRATLPTAIEEPTRPAGFTLEDLWNTKPTNSLRI